MILKDPYQFKLLELMNNTKTIESINRYIAVDYMYIKDKAQIKIRPFSDPYTTLNPVLLFGLSDTEKDIPVFNFPIIDKSHNWIALDLRAYVKPSIDRESYEIKNESEYIVAIHRFIMTAAWYTGNQNAIYSLRFGHFAFASWLSDNLTKKFGLDMSNEVQLRALGLIYYSKLFTDDYTPDDFTKLLIRSKDDILMPKLLEEVNSKIDKLENIDDFCRACYPVTGNFRLKDLDYGVLSNVIGSNWIGHNGKELALVSLEHPPTWLSLVYASLTQRSFRKSYIATLVDRLDRRGKGEEYLTSLVALTKDWKER